MPQTLCQNEFGSVTQYYIDEKNTIPALNIEHQHCKATVCLLGGQLLSWQPTNHRPVFWLSERSAFEEGKAIRGGIPICWPWFGPFKNGGNHGFARQSLWQLNSVNITKNAVELSVSFSGVNQHSLWPSQFEITQSFELGQTFSQQLTIQNLSPNPVNYSAALHSYFCVSSPKNVTVPLLAQADYYDKIVNQNKMANEQVPCVGPVDRVYYCSNEQKIIDADWQRVINVKSSQCDDWVLWNPGVELAKNMADIHSNGEQEFICLEAANTRFKTIPANSAVTLSQLVTIQPIEKSE